MATEDSEQIKIPTIFGLRQDYHTKDMAEFIGALESEVGMSLSNCPVFVMPGLIGHLLAGGVDSRFHGNDERRVWNAWEKTYQMSFS